MHYIGTTSYLYTVPLLLSSWLPTTIYVSRAPVSATSCKIAWSTKLSNKTWCGYFYETSIDHHNILTSRRAYANLSS